MRRLREDRPRLAVPGAGSVPLTLTLVYAKEVRTQTLVLEWRSREPGRRESDPGSRPCAASILRVCPRLVS